MIMTQVVDYKPDFDHYLIKDGLVFEYTSSSGLIFEDLDPVDELMISDTDRFSEFSNLVSPVGDPMPLILFINQETYEEVRQELQEAQAEHEGESHA